MKLLLDTQILVWLAEDRRRLNIREKTAIETAGKLIVSVLSLIELRIKARAEQRRGRPPSLLSPADAIAFCERRQIFVSSVRPTDITVALSVDPSHGDPFDEMLLAHARALDALLLTRDDLLRGHPLAYHP